MRLEGTVKSVENLPEKIKYMVLGGAGFNDVLTYYGLLTLFSVLIFFILIYLLSVIYRSILIKNVRIIIYHDIKYPTSWINRHFSSEIANFAQRLNADIMDANQLSLFMRDAIIQNNNLTLVVFSQDIVPNTIIEESFSTNTLREFLDIGGSVLWIGDIPLFYTGYYDESLETSARQHVWLDGALQQQHK